MATIEIGRADDLGPALREARLADGLTQTDLAEAAGVGRQWLNAFEAGDKPSARLDMILRIIDILDVSVTLTRPTRHLPAAPPDKPLDLDAFLKSFDQ